MFALLTPPDMQVRLLWSGDPGSGGGLCLFIGGDIMTSNTAISLANVMVESNTAHGQCACVWCECVCVISLGAAMGRSLNFIRVVARDQHSYESGK
jgi:hypothetical protein